MFDVLMYLFETYIHSDADVMVEQDELTDELSRAGFDNDEIEKALDRDTFLEAEEAMKFGIVDKVFETRPDSDKVGEDGAKD